MPFDLFKMFFIWVTKYGFSHSFFIYASFVNTPHPSPSPSQPPIPPRLNLHRPIVPISTFFFLRSSISHPLRHASPLCLLPNFMASKDSPRSKKQNWRVKTGVCIWERPGNIFFCPGLSLPHSGFFQFYPFTRSWIKSHCVDVPHLHYSSSDGGHPGCFHFLALVGGQSSAEQGWTVCHRVLWDYVQRLYSWVICQFY